jgi:hypothetical protein
MTMSHSRGDETHYICWSRSDMSMNCVGCPNHILQHDTSQKPKSPTTATCVRPSIHQAVVASLQPLATIEGAETLHIGMKKT